VALQRKKEVETATQEPETEEHQNLVVGIIGGIASGKSTVVETLEAEGAYVIKGDQIGHQLYAVDTPVYKQVVSTFGDQIIGEDKQIDRKILGKIVFSNKDEKKKLDNIMWPAIYQEIQKQVHSKQQEAKQQKRSSLLFIEAAILLEAQWHKSNLFTHIWLLEIPHELAKNRLMKRNNLTEEEAKSRLNSQLTNVERRKKLVDSDLIHVVIPNTGTKEELTEEIKNLYQQLKNQIS